MKSGAKYSRAQLGYNDTGVSFAAGDLLALDATSPSGKLYVVAGGTATIKPAVLVSANATGHCFICPLPAQEASIMASTAVVAVGDHMVTSGTRRAAADAAPAAYTSCGKALMTKANGAEGLVTIGPA